MKKVLILSLVLSVFLTSSINVYGEEFDKSSNKIVNINDNSPETDTTLNNTILEDNTESTDSDYIKIKEAKKVITYDDIMKNEFLIDKKGKAKISIKKDSFLILVRRYTSNSFSLYSDKNYSNKIIGRSNEGWCIVKKGTYYIDISDDVYICYVPIDKFLNISVTRKNGYYYVKSETPMTLFGSHGYMSDRVFGSPEVKFRIGEYFIKTDGGVHNLSLSFDNVADGYNKLDFRIDVEGKTAKLVKEEKDTKKPTVSGVKNNKTYKKPVTIKVSDKSGIKKVTLNGKDKSVEKFKKGAKISKNGKYTLEVVDKCGNKKVVKFKIKM